MTHLTAAPRVASDPHTTTTTARWLLQAGPASVGKPSHSHSHWGTRTGAWLHGSSMWATRVDTIVPRRGGGWGPVHLSNACAIQHAQNAKRSGCYNSAGDRSFCNAGGPGASASSTLPLHIYPHTRPAQTQQLQGPNPACLPAHTAKQSTDTGATGIMHGTSIHRNRGGAQGSWHAGISAHSRVPAAARPAQPSRHSPPEQQQNDTL